MDYDTSSSGVTTAPHGAPVAWSLRAPLPAVPDSGDIGKTPKAAFFVVSLPRCVLDTLRHLRATPARGIAALVRVARNRPRIARLSLVLVAVGLGTGALLQPKVEAPAPPVTDADAPSSPHITAASIDDAGNVWIATDRGEKKALSDDGGNEAVKRAADGRSVAWVKRRESAATLSIYRDAHTKSITGLPVRAFWFTATGQQIVIDSGETDQPGSLLLYDLDRLRQVGSADAADASGSQPREAWTVRPR